MAYRSTPTYTFSVPGFSRGVKLLILITCGVFILQWLGNAGIPPLAQIRFINWFGLNTNTFLHGALWQPFTYLFLHAGFWHLFWNMFGLWMFGVAVEEALGYSRFLRLYIISGVGGGLVDVFLHWILHAVNPLVYTIGASGAIFGILLAFGIMFPNQPVFLLLPPVSIKAKWLVLGYGVLEFFFAVNPTSDKVAHIAHLGGMLFAFLYLKSRRPNFGLRSSYDHWKRRRQQRRFEVYMSKRDRHDNSRRWMN